ncbi:MAG: FkbM family methyltransferase [Acidimicrobiia bacterium]|nr:FkbM family methyltransferase [Acidimicrobiia bacterium]
MRACFKSAAYGAVEIATLRRGIARRINGEVVRFPARWCRYYPAEYERAKHDFVVQHCRPGSAAIDLGAHLGLFTVAMARAVGARGLVVAVEPTPSTRAALERTIALNGLDAVVAIRSEVVTDRVGVAVPFFTTADPLSNANSVVASSLSRASFEAPSTTIDDIVEALDRPVSCVKLDIEGAELVALRGAGRTVQLHRPALAVEVHPVQLRQAGFSATELWTWLLDAAYLVTRDGGPVSKAWFTGQPGCFEIQAVARP